MFRRLLYSKPIAFILKLFCSLFYSSKHLQGKFLDEKRMGYYWVLSSIRRLPSLHRRGVNWPVGRNTEILGGHRIKFAPSSINVFQQSGCYYQAFANITIGKNVWIGPNTGLITANHKLSNPEEHEDGKPIVIGNNVRIGMNCVLLPSVVLGDNTIVGAGSIVTKPFSMGSCVLAGNPARIIRVLNNEVF